jgi:hypoxanthine phosphoribosyltransferase
MKQKIDTLLQRNIPLDPAESLREVEPLLTTLADKLLDTEQDRWNVIIGDDTSGRLPTRFIRDVLKADGRDFATFFVVGSAVYRDANGPGPYEQWFDRISRQVGEPLRPLVVTESVGTGAAVNFIRKTMEQYCEQGIEPEIATVAVSDEAEDMVDFYGGKGREALNRTWQGFENPPKISLARTALKKLRDTTPNAAVEYMRSRTSLRLFDDAPQPNHSLGIYSDTTAELPIAGVMPGTDRAAASRLLRRMDELADEYVRDRPSAH